LNRPALRACWLFDPLVHLMQIAPALATGNTIVAKPSEITPLTGNWLSLIVSVSFASAFFLQYLSLAMPAEHCSFPLSPAYLLSIVMDHVGLPAGVCNVIYGTGPATGGPLVAHEDVPIISFTGGTLTGRR
jgi:aminomuconate-semialdehyde/2-hydroxymuconate-6-semialdehyde dehydrogenase